MRVKIVFENGRYELRFPTKDDRYNPLVCEVDDYFVKAYNAHFTQDCEFQKILQQISRDTNQ